MLSSLWKHPHLISACWSQTIARTTTMQVFSPPSAEIVQSGGFHVIMSFSNNGTKTLSQWDWWWWCMSLQPMRLRNVPDFLDWTFPASNMQDHKGKQKIPPMESSYMEYLEEPWKEISQKHDKERFQDVSENRNIVMSCQSMLTLHQHVWFVQLRQMLIFILGKHCTNLFGC